MKQNPFIWGAWGGIAGALICFTAYAVGQPLPQNTWQGGMAGLFWGIVIALIWNWLGRRKLY